MTRTARTLICGWLLLLSAAVYAQRITEEAVSTQLFGNSGHDRLLDIVQHNDGGFSLAGTSSKGENKGEDMLYVHLDENWKEVSRRNIGRSGNDGCNAITTTPFGNCLLAGYSEKSSRGNPSGKQAYFGKKDGWLVEVSKNGQAIREYIAGTTGDDDFIAVFRLPSAQLLLVGNAGSKAWLQCLDENWGLRWERTFDHYNQPTTVVGAALDQQENLYLVGYTQGEQGQQLWLANINAEGGLVWEKALPSSVGNTGSRICTLPNGELLVVGNVTDERKREEGFYLKIDPMGNTLVYKQLGGQEDDRLADAIALHNGKTALLGSSQSFERGSRRPSVWFCLMDEQDQLEEQRFYGSKTIDEGRVLLQTHTGSIMAAGHTGQLLMKSTQGWLARLSDEAETGTPKSPPLIEQLTLQASQVTHVNAGESAAILASIHNPNREGLTHARVVVAFSPDLGYSSTPVLLPPIPPDATVQVALPFHLPGSLQFGSVDAQVSLRHQGDTILAVDNLTIPVGKAPVMAMSVDFMELPAPLRVGQIGKLGIKVKNDGSLDQQHVLLTLSTSSSARLPYELKIGHLIAGESKVYELPVEIPLPFGDDSLHVNARLSNENLDYSVVQKASWPVINTDILAPAILENTSQPLTAVWLFPNPDQYDHDAIVWGEQEITIQIKVISKQPLTKQDFCIEINGRPCPVGAKMDEVTMKGNSQNCTFSQRINLAEGVNTLRAIIRHPQGQYSTEPIQLVHSPRKPNLHLLALGVPSVDLKFTDKDARDFARAIYGGSNQPNTAFGQIFVDTLLNERSTTKTEILKAFRRLRYRYDDRQIQAHDVVMVFVSSHGLRSPEGDFRIAASDYDSPFWEETSLDIERDMLDYLEGMQCRKVFFIDACHSGAGVDGGSGLVAVNGASVTDWASSHADVSFVLSCQGAEYSYEDESWQNGAFTAAIVQKLSTSAHAPLNLRGLFEHLQAQVPVLVQSKRPKTPTAQHPQLQASPDMEQLLLFDHN